MPQSYFLRYYKIFYILIVCSIQRTNGTSLSIWQKLGFGHYKSNHKVSSLVDQSNHEDQYSTALQHIPIPSTQEERRIYTAKDGSVISSRTIGQLLEEDNDSDKNEYDIFYNLLVISGLLDTLLYGTIIPLTVFIPTNVAMVTKLDPWLYARISSKYATFPNYQLHLENFLCFHTVGNVVFNLEDVPVGTSIAPMMNNETVVFRKTSKNSKTFTVSYTNYVSVAPNDTITINVTKPDFYQGANGVVHEIDGVLIPKFMTTTLLDIIQTDPNYSIFNELLMIVYPQGIDSLSELVELAQYPDAIIQLPANQSQDIEDVYDVTVFAPTNAAFLSIGADLIKNIQAAPDTVEQISILIRNHVVRGVLPTVILDPQTKFVAAGGLAIEVTNNTSTASATEKQIILNNITTIVEPNILAIDGILQGIDSLLLAPLTFQTKEGATTGNSSSALSLTLGQVLQKEDEYSIFYNAIQVGGLLDALNSIVPLTVFVPTNDAFQLINDVTFNWINTKFPQSAYKLHLQNFVSYHILNNIRFQLSDVTNVTTLQMTSNEPVNITKNFTYTITYPTFNTTTGPEPINIDTPDWNATLSNGVIYSIDGVLLPQFFHSNFYELLVNDPDQKYSIISKLFLLAYPNGIHTLETKSTDESDYTLLAPTDAAFSKVLPTKLDSLQNPQNIYELKSFLSNHLIVGVVPLMNTINETIKLTTQSGTSVTIDTGSDKSGLQNRIYQLNQNITISDPDRLSIDGIVHGIDTVLDSGDETNTNTNLAEILAEEPDLSILYKLFQVAGLEEALTNGIVPLTIFAPVNTAFTNVSSNEKQFSDWVQKQFLEPEYIVHLQSFLSYHTINVEFLSTDVPNGVTVAPMLNGDNITFTKNASFDDSTSGIMLSYPVYNGTSKPVMEYAKVIETELVATSSHGVIHKLDKILFPRYFFTTFMDIFGNDKKYSIFHELIQLAYPKSGLLLSDEQTLTTVLAPTNEAFETTFDNATLQTFRDPNNSDQVASLIMNHLIPGIKPTGLLENGMTYVTIGGLEVDVEIIDLGNDDTLFKLNDAQIIQPDILSIDGIVQGISVVLLETTESSQAPNSGSAILSSYPSLSPSNNNRGIDIPTIPVTNNTTSTTDLNETTIMDILNAQPDLSVIANAVVVAGLSAALEGSVPFTIFAPVDYSFNKTTGTVFDPTYFNKLLQPGWLFHLLDLLSYHAINVEVNSSELPMGTNVAPMMNGQNLTIDKSSDGNIALSYPLYDDDGLKKDTLKTVNVVQVDLLASNGVVHKLHGILLPRFVFTPLTALLGQRFRIFHEILTIAYPDNLPAGDYTILSPSDEAFIKLGNDILNSLRDPVNSKYLMALVNDHIIAEAIPTTLLDDGNTFRTIGGSVLNVVHETDTIYIDKATVIDSDLLAWNGIVHGIDSLLSQVIVPSLEPTNQPTSSVMDSDSPQASLTPSSSREIEVPSTNSSLDPTKNSTLLDVIEDTLDLSILEKLIRTADLVPALEGDVPLTIFAPVNTSFQKSIGVFDQQYVDLLLQPEWTLHLQNLLSYHAINVEVNSSELPVGVNVAPMLNGESLTISKTEAGRITLSYPSFNGTENGVVESITRVDVVEADLIASNGILHKLDGVLLPKFIFTPLAAALAESFSKFYDLFTRAFPNGLPKGTYTILAPTDSSLLALDEAELESLKGEASTSFVVNFVQDHIVANVIPTLSIDEKNNITSLGGLALNFSSTSDKLFINDAQVIQPNILASDGIIHGIDKVLSPGSSSTNSPSKSPTTRIGLTSLPSNIPTPVINSVTTIVPSQLQQKSLHPTQPLQDTPIDNITTMSPTLYKTTPPSNTRNIETTPSQRPTGNPITEPPKPFRISGLPSTLPSVKPSFFRTPQPSEQPIEQSSKSSNSPSSSPSIQTTEPSTKVIEPTTKPTIIPSGHLNQPSMFPHSLEKPLLVHLPTYAPTSAPIVSTPTKSPTGTEKEIKPSRDEDEEHSNKSGPHEERSNRKSGKDGSDTSHNNHPSKSKHSKSRSHVSDKHERSESVHERPRSQHSNSRRDKPENQHRGDSRPSKKPSRKEMHSKRSKRNSKEGRHHSKMSNRHHEESRSGQDNDSRSQQSHNREMKMSNKNSKKGSHSHKRSHAGKGMMSAKTMSGKGKMSRRK